MSDCNSRSVGQIRCPIVCQDRMPGCHIECQNMCQMKCQDVWCIPSLLALRQSANAWFFFPYGNLTHLLLKPWPIEIVDLPSYTMAIFHSFLYVYQGALCLGKKKSFVFGFFVVHVSSQFTATQPRRIGEGPQWWDPGSHLHPGRHVRCMGSAWDVWDLSWLIKGHRWYAYHPCCTFTYSYMFGAHVGKYAIHGDNWDNLRSWLCLKMGMPFKII